jgi:hypothetical protein
MITPRVAPLHLTLSATMLLLAAAAARAEPPEDVRMPDSGPGYSDEPAHNYCLGGIEDRKVIVEDDRISNPFRQTSRLGCEVDGGRPQTMPDLPAPSAVHRRLV